MSSSSFSLPYHEPGIVSILIYSSFILLLNVANFVIDKVAYCGLIGQILLGVAFGTPGGNWLVRSTEHVIVELGYLGLLLIVYEGGLATSFKSVKANLFLSAGVALTGVCLPIGFSYVLVGLVGATPLQSFAAGAALCSTSLGTTFTVLSTTGLSNTRMGVVLSSAAMMDDVVGLVMVQVISNLDSSGAEFDPISVIQPVFVSLGFAVIVPLGARFVVRPLALQLNNLRESNLEGYINKCVSRQHFALVTHTFILIALIIAASYAGTSNLFAAYLAGASISWWDSEVLHVDMKLDNPARVLEVDTEATDQREGVAAMNHPEQPISTMAPEVAPGAAIDNQQDGKSTFEAYYGQPLNKILRPFFFASIGFSIPISQLFRGSLIWRGLIYMMLMTVGKLACGLWLVRFSFNKTLISQLRLVKARLPSPTQFWCFSVKAESSVQPKAGEASKAESQRPKEDISSCEGGKPNSTPAQQTVRSQDGDAMEVQSDEGQNEPSPSSTHPHQIQNPSKPSTLYPATIVGSAMVARGEIGFLISSLAESKGIFGTGVQSEVFLVVTWAILLCTVIGPITVGLLVNRVKKLERKRVDGGLEGASENPLGLWGVSS